jgi:O-antigen/teichoic acid export membrane protein
MALSATMPQRAHVGETRFARVMLATVVVQGLAAIPYAVFAAMQSRLLGAAGRGDVALLVTITFFAAALADMGYTPAMAFQVGQHKHNPRTLLGNFLVWSAVSIPCTLAVLLLLGSSLDVLGIGDYAQSYAVSILVMLCANQLYNFVSSEALSWKDYSTYNALSAIAQGTMPVVLGLVYIVAPAHLSVRAVLGCYSAGYLVAALASLAMARPRLMMYGTRACVSLAALRDHLRVGVRSLLSVMAGQLLLRLDIFLLYFFVRDSSALGFYSVAILVAAMWTQVPGWLAMTLRPKAAHGDPDHRAITSRSAGAALCISLLAGAAWLVLAPVLPRAFELGFGAGFGVVYGLVVLLLPRLILSPAGELLAGNLAGRGYSLYHPLASIVALVSSVALNVVLIPRYGTAGAAVSMSLSYLLQFAVILRGYCVVNGLAVIDVIRENRMFWTQVVTRLIRPGHPPITDLT